MPIVSIPVTLIAAAACAFLNLWLSIRIGRTRGAEKVSVGDGGSEPLIRRMRAQANFVENAPFFLILVAAIELSAGTGPWLWAAAGAFLLARICHGIGMDGGGFKAGRMIGTALTMLLLLALAVWAVAIVYAAGHAPAATTFEAAPAKG